MIATWMLSGALSSRLPIIGTSSVGHSKVNMFVATPTAPLRYFIRADSARCTLGETATALDSAHILVPGRYTLTLESTAGTGSGQRSSGLLELWPTSAADRSPAWPAERPPAGDTVRTVSRLSQTMMAQRGG